jgi:MFS family permease
MSAVPSSLSARIVGYHALHEFIPLYPLYGLLFTDHGLSAAEISTLFIIWSTTTFLLEVPSGAWADTYSRRRLLILGALIGGLGFASWIVVLRTRGSRPASCCGARVRPWSREPSRPSCTTSWRRTAPRTGMRRCSAWPRRPRWS